MVELGLKPELACARDHCTTQPLPFLIFICLGYGKQARDKEMNSYFLLKGKWGERRQGLNPGILASEHHLRVLHRIWDQRGKGNQLGG